MVSNVSTNKQTSSSKIPFFPWRGDGAGGLKVMFISKIRIFFNYDIYNIVKFLMSILNVGR